MYSIEEYINNETQLNCVKISNGKNTLMLYPEYGAAVSELKLNKKIIITTPDQINTPNTFASSVLFPFANRIKNGSYTFNGTTYQLYKNENSKSNAIHGLIYSKAFNIDSYNLDNNKASISLTYSSKDNTFKGFPFRFQITLQYTLTANALALKVIVKNKDTAAFPFSLGWHPYFYTENHKGRQLQLSAKSKFINNKAMIPVGVEENVVTHLPINRHFDDCYMLSNGNISYITNDYNLHLSSNADKNYLQLFTPENPEFFAIEYMTGPPNCFNTKTDLLILQPNEIFNATWKIQLIE